MKSYKFKLKNGTDTPEEIKKLQLKIWLYKTPAERLHQMMLDNEALFHFWRCLKQ